MTHPENKFPKAIVFPRDLLRVQTLVAAHAYETANGFPGKRSYLYRKLGLNALKFIKASNEMVELSFLEFVEGPPRTMRLTIAGVLFLRDRLLAGPPGENVLPRADGRVY